MGRRALDFTSTTRKLICDKVAGRCSNPNCRRLARFPNHHGSIINLGEAAHIVAAASAGPRPRTNGETDRYLRSEENGLWLCASCHALIDRDPSSYSEERLTQWKLLAEKALDYDAPAVAVSLPAHIRNSDSALGLHVLCGPGAGLQGVCHRLCIEVMTRTGTSQLRARRFYRDKEAGVPEEGADWHSFLLKIGDSSSVYFAADKAGWSDSLGAISFDPILIRAKIFGRTGNEWMEPFCSPWELGLIGYSPTPSPYKRVEFDEQNRFVHLLDWAEVLHKLSQSRDPSHKNLCERVLDAQLFRGKPRFVVQSMGNAYIESAPDLIDFPGTTIAPLETAGEKIEGAFERNRYILKRSRTVTAGSRKLEVTDVQEFWYGADSDYITSPAKWDRRWVHGGKKSQRMLPDVTNHAPPGF